MERGPRRIKGEINKTSEIRLQSQRRNLGAMKCCVCVCGLWLYL